LGMLHQITHSHLERFEVRLVNFIQRGASMHLQGFHRGDQYHGRWPESGLTTFDVEKLFSAEVEAKAGLGDDKIGSAERQARCQNAVAAMRDIAEWATMHERRHPFYSLHKIWFECILENDSHCLWSLNLARGDRFAFAGETDDDA